MYQFKFLVSFLSLLLITSCSSDDDGIVGSWILTNVALTSCPPDIPETTIKADNGCVFILEESLCLDMEFTSGGAVVITFSYDDDAPDRESGTYVDNGDSIEICFDGDCQSLSLNNDNLVLIGREEGCQVEYAFTRN